MQKQETAVAIKRQEFNMIDTRFLAASFAKSGYFADAKEEAQAVVKIMAGRELGLPEVYSMTKIFFVQGRITLSAEAMGALIKRSGRYDYRVIKLDNDECILHFFDNGEMVYESTFTMDDANKAELIKDHGNWKKWPRPMLMSKALSQGARIVCPHIISGAYTPEDFGIETDDEGNISQPQRVSQVTIEGEVVQPTVSPESLHEAMQMDQPVKAPVPEVRTKMEEVIKKADAVLEGKVETPEGEKIIASQTNALKSLKAICEKKNKTAEYMDAFKKVKPAGDMSFEKLTKTEAASLIESLNKVVN